MLVVLPIICRDSEKRPTRRTIDLKFERLPCQRLGDHRSVGPSFPLVHDHLWRVSEIKCRCVRLVPYGTVALPVPLPFGLQNAKVRMESSYVGHVMRMKRTKKTEGQQYASERLMI